MFDYTKSLLEKIFVVLIIILMILSSKYDYAYSDNKLIIENDMVTTVGNMITSNDTNYINVDLLIKSGINMKKVIGKIPLVVKLETDAGIIILLNHKVIFNNMVNYEDILNINGEVFIAVKNINVLDNSYIIDWNGKYKFIRIKKADNIVTNEEIIYKYGKEFGIYEIDGVKSPLNPTKFAYITFDDGPSKTVTGQILDILKETNSKATFFVNGVNIKGKEAILTRTINEGHTIGNHTYTHKSNMYNSFDTFKKEVSDNENLIENITGYKTTIFRFPYGINVSNTYKNYLKERGYTTYYWNVDPGDSRIKNVTANTLINNVKNQIKNKEDVIIILHDMENKKETVKALKNIIKILWENGYELKAIDSTIKMNTTARIY